MKRIRANWKTSILICRKCSKKAGGGFGRKGGTSLAKALRAHLDLGKGRKAAIGLLEVDCLKICPKRAITVVDNARPRDWLLVEPGTPIADVAALLGLGSAE